MQIQINLDKKHLFIIAFVGIILAVGLGFAYKATPGSTNIASTMGHSVDEIDWTQAIKTTPTDSVITLDTGAANKYAAFNLKDSGTAYWGIGKDAGNNFYIQRSSSAGRGIFMLESNGNVGIGASSPAYKLDVAGTVNSNSYGNYNYILSEAARTFGLAVNTNTGSFAIDDISANPDANVLTITHTGVGGYIGIGTTTPTKKLDVVGDIKSSGTICDGSGNCLNTVGGSSTQAFVTNAVTGRVRVADVGCAGGYGSSCDNAGNGYIDYADVAGTANYVAWSDVANKPPAQTVQFECQWTCGRCDNFGDGWVLRQFNDNIGNGCAIGKSHSECCRFYLA